MLGSDDATDLVLYKVRCPHGTRLRYTHLCGQPTIQIRCIPEAACLEQIRALNFSDAIKLDGGYKIAAIFPQLVAPDTLEALKNRTTRRLAIPLEHDPKSLGEPNTLDEDHLHIIVAQPHTGDYHLLHIICELIIFQNQKVRF